MSPGTWERWVHESSIVRFLTKNMKKPELGPAKANRSQRGNRWNEWRYKERRDEVGRPKKRKWRQADQRGTDCVRQLKRKTGRSARRRFSR